MVVMAKEAVTGSDSGVLQRLDGEWKCGNGRGAAGVTSGWQA